MEIRKFSETYRGDGGAESALGTHIRLGRMITSLEERATEEGFTLDWSTFWMETDYEYLYFPTLRSEGVEEKLLILQMTVSGGRVSGND